MSTATIEFTDVAVGFGSGPDVVRGLDLRLADGEFVSIIGPSGCGKSTVLNIASGLLPVRAGTALFRGEPIRDVNTEVGYMTQDDTLLPWRTVLDNVAMPLRLRNVPRAEARRRAAEVLDLIDLTAAARKYPSQLSGGMKRRALLGRSMIYDPAVLLMDEPFAALDAQLREQMHVELTASVRAAGQAVLFITHDIHEAVLLSDRIVVLGGTPASVAAEVRVPFGRDRDVTRLQFDPAFLQLNRDVHHHLYGARTAGDTQEDHR